MVGSDKNKVRLKKSRKNNNIYRKRKKSKDKRPKALNRIGKK